MGRNVVHTRHLGAGSCRFCIRFDDTQVNESYGNHSVSACRICIAFLASALDSADGYTAWLAL